MLGPMPVARSSYNSSSLDSPATTGGQNHSHHARGRGRVRTSRHVVFDRERPPGHAASGGKGIFPARPSFPLLHIDTTWKCRAMILFRDEILDHLRRTRIVELE